MPRTASKDIPQWVKDFRRAIKTQCPVGWLVVEHNGTVKLEVHDSAVGKKQTLKLPFQWDESQWADALLRIRVIAKSYASGGLDLRGAAKLSERASSSYNTDWQAAVIAFREHRTRVADRTWDKKYKPVLSYALKALSAKKSPTNGSDLCDLALRQWALGTRQRQIMRQNLFAFLRFCVLRRNFRACWLPPEVIEGEAVNQKRDGYPMTDLQILRLLDALPQSNIANRWRFAIQLMAVYGCRPEDLRYIKTKRAGTELWSDYEKSQGGTKGKRTEKRRLYPLLVNDIDGSVDWNLQQRIHLREDLPSLGQPGKGGEAVGTYLRRQPTWQSIAAEAEAEGEKLTPYSFRHRYSAAGHARGLQPKQMADAMGHSLEVHMGSYARFMTRDLADAFDAVNGSSAKDQKVMNRRLKT